MLQRARSSVSSLWFCGFKCHRYSTNLQIKSLIHSVLNSTLRSKIHLYAWLLHRYLISTQIWTSKGQWDGSYVKPNNPSPIPRTYMTKWENCLQQFVLWPLHTRHDTHILTPLYFPHKTNKYMGWILNIWMSKLTDHCSPFTLLKHIHRHTHRHITYMETVCNK